LFGDTHSDNAPAFICSLNSGSGRNPNLPQWASGSLVHGECHFPQFLVTNRLGPERIVIRRKNILHVTETNSRSLYSLIDRYTRGHVVTRPTACNYLRPKPIIQLREIKMPALPIRPHRVSRK
jgi:hypothetical protein